MIPAQDPAPNPAQTWRDFATIEVCGRVMIRPAWLPTVVDRAPGAVELVMEPGEAFGAGTHVTTRLCVEAASDLVRGGESVLDVGSGTGVLAVAAVLLGAEDAVAIDIDPEAVRVTALVAAMNSVGDRVQVSGTRLDRLDGQYDLVFANQLIPVIEELGPAIVERLAPVGRLVVSGVLVEQVERALIALAPLAVESSVQRDGWARLVLRGTR